MSQTHQDNSNQDLGMQGRVPPAVIYTIFACIFLGIVAYLYGEFPEISNDSSIAGNVGLFLLININIIVLMFLIFLAGKNIWTLIVERRQNILGSRLRAKLAAAFLALSLIPTILLFLVAKGILETVLQEWFSPQVTNMVDSAMGVVKTHHEIMSGIVLRESRMLGRKVADLSSRLDSLKNDASKNENVAGNEEFGLGKETLENLQQYLAGKREEYGLTAVTVVDRSGRQVAMALSPTPNLPMHNFQLAAQGMEEALQGRVFVGNEDFPEGQFIRGYAPISKALPIGELVGEGDNGKIGVVRFVLVTDLQILPALSGQLQTAIESFSAYRELKTYRRPLASSYLLTLVVVTLLIVFSAVWAGFYLAKGLSVPIGLLAQATAEVAQGNLDLRIPEVGDDELSILVRSFNTMTADLKRTTGELVQRRRYMETVFASLEVGVVSMDTRFRITTMNRSAAVILAVDARSAISRPIGEVLPAELSAKVGELGEQLFRTRDRMREATGSVTSGGQAKHLQLVLSKLTDDQEGSLGAVLLIDDISELVSAQRMAAWREVARRIAHEIKNPLTPIQLNAERLQRRYGGKEEYAVIGEATESIVKQVESLRNLVNEFSRFARMPKSNPQPGDLGQLLEETLRVFRGAHPEITFELHLPEKLPQVAIDKDQMSRVFVNLFDNAVAAVQSETPGVAPRIEVSAETNEEVGLVSIHVKDNGVGISKDDLPRLFEPYFSTKKGGTGLGLAIVSAIIADHNGFIRVKNNVPRGAWFSIELPAQNPSVRRGVM